MTTPNPEIPCSADLNHPCGSGEDEQPCARCIATHAYWLAQWNAYGREEVANRLTREEIESCYSEPCEAVKREGMLRELDNTP